MFDSGLMMVEGQSQQLKNMNSFVQKSISNKEAKTSMNIQHVTSRSRFRWRQQLRKNRNQRNHNQKWKEEKEWLQQVVDLYF